MWAVFILSGIGLLLVYLLPIHSPPHKGPKGIPALPGERVQLTGIIKSFGSNRNGDIDQFVLQNKDGETQVRFPPHIARQLMQLAPEGTTVSIKVHTGPPHPPGPAGEVPVYQLEQLQAGNAVLPVTDMPLPPPAAGKPVELSGTVDSLITGRQGEVTSFVVSGYRIALPPHLAYSIAPLLQQGKLVRIKGYERISNDDFVNTGQLPLVKPTRITIDSTDYLL